MRRSKRQRQALASKRDRRAERDSSPVYRTASTSYRSLPGLKLLVLGGALAHPYPVASVGLARLETVCISQKWPLRARAGRVGAEPWRAFGGARRPRLRLRWVCRLLDTAVALPGSRPPLADTGGQPTEASLAGTRASLCGQPRRAWCTVPQRTALY